MLFDRTHFAMIWKFVNVLLQYWKTNGLTFRWMESSTCWYLSTTDKGSNESYSRKMLHVLLNDCKNVLFVDLDCFEHGSHLITLGGLKLMDSMLKSSPHSTFKYFTSCAIVSNVMRDLAKDIYFEWCLTYGACSANETVKKLMPKCNSGRWGSVHATEERFLKMNPIHLATVVKTVLGKKAEKANKKKQPKLMENDLNPNTLALEQAAEYTARMGKWRRYALETVQDSLWLKCIDIMHRSRGPVMHFTHIVRTRPSTSELRRFGGQVCQLVNGKMLQVMTEFNDLLDENRSAWAEQGIAMLFCYGKSIYNGF